MTIGKRIRWIFAIFVLLLGVVTVDFQSLKWGALGISLFSIALIIQFSNCQDLQIYALWGGFFLSLQTLLSPFLINRDFKTLPHNIHQIVNIRAGIPGINGRQVITTDSKGFRTTRDIDYKNNNTYRIFVIGGSTTEQIYLDDRHTWTHLLQEYLSKKITLQVEVINTGVSGTRAKHHLATLKNIIKLYPDLVIFLMGINDWNWHIVQTFSRESLFTKIKDYRTNFLLRATMVGNFIRIVYSYYNNFMTEDIKEKIKEDYGEYYSKQRDSLSRKNVYSFHPKYVHDEYQKELLEISDICRESNIKCLFITQPTGYQNSAKEEFKKGFWMTPPNKTYTLDFQSMVHIAYLYNCFLLKFSRENGHYFCDAASGLGPTFENFYDDCHFNINGAKNMAKIVSKCVVDFYEQQH